MNFSADTFNKPLVQLGQELSSFRSETHEWFHWSKNAWHSSLIIVTSGTDKVCMWYKPFSLMSFRNKGCWRLRITVAITQRTHYLGVREEKSALSNVTGLLGLVWKSGKIQPWESRRWRVLSLKNLLPMYSINFKVVGRRELVILFRLWWGCWDLVNKKHFYSSLSGALGNDLISVFKGLWESLHCVVGQGSSHFKLRVRGKVYILGWRTLVCSHLILLIWWLLTCYCFHLPDLNERESSNSLGGWDNITVAL